MHIFRPYFIQKFYDMTMLEKSCWTKNHQRHRQIEIFLWYSRIFRSWSPLNAERPTLFITNNPHEKLVTFLSICGSLAYYISVTSANFGAFADLINVLHFVFFNLGINPGLGAIDMYRENYLKNNRHFSFLSVM